MYVPLLSSALPPELYSIWEAYPWKFGQTFCIFKSYLNEVTPYAGVLTITAFTVERYLAICHPLREQRGSRQARALRCVLTVWLVSALCALPYPVHTRVFPWAINPLDQSPIEDSLVCNIPVKWLQTMIYCFQISTFVFFILPMIVITIMYMMIGVRLRNSAVTNDVTAQTAQSKTVATRARRAVLKMLVAVVVAFFVCWAPFHAQRLMTVYIRHDQWTPELLTLQSHLFYVSGILYFMSCTINPILYNLLSRKFRQAFKRTLCRCCIGFDAHSIPVFYRLRAKFVNTDGHSEGLAPRADAVEVGSGHVGGHGVPPHHHIMSKQALIRWTADKNLDIRLAHVGGEGRGGGNLFNTFGCRAFSRRYAHPSTKETTFIDQNSSSSGAHAHSDSRLHRLCRHKDCFNGRASAMEGLTPPSGRTQSTCSGPHQQHPSPASTLPPVSHHIQGPFCKSSCTHVNSDDVNLSEKGNCRVAKITFSHQNINTSCSCHRSQNIAARSHTRSNIYGRIGHATANIHGAAISF
ncbi:neuropeptide capa receptor [Plakobranchus ocellatus]|uniref:Neuropeptide capa receptor n=1 Tax=Plakobranchus ocellatus TaxID=259542 RepID=A0AAV4D9A7_9GAST|nr:neuropeptide capa receptor [Plakobranchus ocellatus]